jgi:hypothetical protein
MKTSVHTDFLLGVFISPKDEGDKFLQNPGRLSVDYYTALYHRTITTAVRTSNPA